MALYVYRGFHDDVLVSGGAVVWPEGINAASFGVILVECPVGDCDLDNSSGLDNIDALTWSQLDANPNVSELAVNNYSRFNLVAAARSYAWDSTAGPKELELKYDNAGYPITWQDLGQGSPSAQIGAYVIVRTVDGGANDKVWMADTGATGLPAWTNEQDFTLTLNTEAFLKGLQPYQP